MKTPLIFTISVWESLKDALFCARDVFAVTPFSYQATVFAPIHPEIHSMWSFGKNLSKRSL